MEKQSNRPVIQFPLKKKKKNISTQFFTMNKQWHSRIPKFSQKFLKNKMKFETDNSHNYEQHSERVDMLHFNTRQHIEN